MSLADPAVPGALSPAIVPVLRELGDLKRIHSAGRSGSIATRAFVGAWGALVAGAEPRAVMLEVCAACLAAGRLGDLDRATLEGLGLGAAEVTAVLEGAVGEFGGALDPGLLAEMRAALARPILRRAAPPPFVALLAEQPRAGVTCPGRARAMLEPAENHAEHSLVVALYGVLVAPAFGADPAAVFMAGLAHHLHSAAMPDAGYTGEMLLGAHLEPVIAAARARALGELAAPLRRVVEAAVEPIARDETPEARAFHAADVLDRVLEIEQHLARSALTMRAVIDDYGLVHDGPVKPFHDAVLRRVGLCG